MTKQDVELEQINYAVDYEVLCDKVNKYYNRVKNDYSFYKRLYLESIEKDRINNRHETTMKVLNKQIESLEYYFHDVLMVKSSEDTETEEDEKEEELDF